MKNLTVEEHICKQIKFLRDCFEEYRTEAGNYAAAKSAVENDEAIANNRLINHTVTNEAGELINLTNDIMRKGYIKDCALLNQQILNGTKERRDLAAQKVELEISVLSALKQLAGDEHFDREILGKYDI